MGHGDVSREPVWDFSHPIKPLVPATLPYSLEDPDYTGWLKRNFRFGRQLCLPIHDRTNNRMLWRDLLPSWVMTSISASISGTPWGHRG